MCIRNRPVSVIYKTLILLLCGFSLFSLVGIPDGNQLETLSYFPTFAILLSTIFYFVAVLHGIGRTVTRGARGEASFSPHFKGTIILVNLINIAIMRQQILPAAQNLLSGNMSMESIAMLSVSVLLPFLVLLDWLLFDPKGRFRTSDPVLWLVPVILYFIYTLLRARFGQPLSTGELYPYDFLSPDFLGWSGVLFNVLFIVVILLIVGFFLVLFDMFMGSRAKTDEEDAWEYADEDYDENEYEEEDGAEEPFVLPSPVSQDTAPLPLHEYKVDEESYSGALFSHEFEPEENSAAGHPAFTQDTLVFSDVAHQNTEASHGGHSLFDDRPSEELSAVPSFSQREISSVPKAAPSAFTSAERPPLQTTAQSSNVTVESLFDAIDRQQATVRTSLGTIELPDTGKPAPVRQAQPTQAPAPVFEAAPEPSEIPPRPYRPVGPGYSVPVETPAAVAEAAHAKTTTPIYRSPFSAPIVSQPEPIQPPAPVQGGFSGINITPPERRHPTARPQPIQQQTTPAYTAPPQPAAPPYQPAPPATPIAPRRSSPPYAVPTTGQQAVPAPYQTRAPYVPAPPQPEPPQPPAPAAVAAPQQYSRPVSAVPAPAAAPQQPQAPARAHRPGFYSPQAQQDGEASGTNRRARNTPATGYPATGTNPKHD